MSTWFPSVSSFNPHLLLQIAVWYLVHFSYDEEKKIYRRVPYKCLHFTHSNILYIFVSSSFWEKMGRLVFSFYSFSLFCCFWNNIRSNTNIIWYWYKYATPIDFHESRQITKWIWILALKQMIIWRYYKTVLKYVA